MAVEYGSMPGVAYEPSPGRYDVAIVEPDGRQRLRLGTALSTAAQFDAVDEVSTPLLQSAIRAGARDTVAVNDAAALAQSVQRVGELLAGTASRVPATTRARAAAGQLIAVFSAKGGVGKSTVAINVAVAMAHRSVDRVALVDADLNFGDVAVLLALQPQHTILDAIGAAQYGDIELVRSMMAIHRSSGLMVLPAPTEPMLGGGIAPSDVVSVLQALQGVCGFVVVDLAAQLDDFTASVLEAADTVLVVGGMDIPSVKNLRIGMQVLDLAALAGPKLRLVLNRSNTQVKLDVREIEQVLGLRADFPIPADIAVPISVNAGVPVVEHDPRAAASRALDRIAVSLMGPEAAPAKRGRRGKRERMANR